MLYEDQIYFSLFMIDLSILIVSLWIINRIESKIWTNNRQMQYLLELVGTLKLMLYSSLAVTILIILVKYALKIFYKIGFAHFTFVMK